MDFYVTVDSRNCSSFNRSAATVSINLPCSINFPGQWVVALCEYGLNNGIFLLEGQLHNHAYLTTNLVSPQIVGDRMYRVLGLIPLDFVPEVPDMSFFFREMQNRQYVPVDSASQTTITLEMQDCKFRPMTLRGKTEVIFRLHFKPISVSC